MKLHPEINREQDWARAALAHADAIERAAVARWAQALLDLRASGELPAIKAQKAFLASLDPAFSTRSLRMIGRELKRLGWDERDGAERLGLSLVGGIALMSSVGLLALAGASGAAALPMWIVFGGGEGFARALIDEAQSADAEAPAASASPLLDEPMMLIQLGRRFQAQMSAEALFEATRGPWRIGADKRERVRVALAVSKGVVREAYRIDGWQADVDSDAPSGARWRFDGAPLAGAERAALLALDVSADFASANPNPLRYRNL